MKNILLLGSGGREHALSLSLASSKLCGRLFIAPGNAGTAEVGTNVNLNPIDFEAIAGFIVDNAIDLLVCGPEEPLVKGLRDHLEHTPGLENVGIIGPGKAGAQLEGSKDFSKRFMQRHSIPTASYRSFQHNQLEDALEYVAQHPLPIVLKADGLAAGKGVVICEDTPTAITTTRFMLEGAFGEASNTLVIESFLKGTELSVFVLTDGKEAIVLPEAKDYKRIYDGDKGPNTGGMGAVSPVPFFEGEFREKVLQKIIHPTIHGLKAEGIPYIGFIFFGLINQDGEPYVIEYNARLGDPETEAILPRLNEDFLDLCIETVSGKLKSRVAEVKPDVATTVMLVSEGYPGAYEKGRKIEFSTASNVTKDTSIRLHSGTLLAPEGTLTNGGRVLAITALASNAHESRAIAYRAVEEVSFTGKCFRNDIGLDLM